MPTDRGAAFSAAFTFAIDEYNNEGVQMIFTHLTFHTWSATALKEFTRVFSTFRKAVSCPLYAFGEDATDKFSRFVTRLGFVPLPNRIVCGNGEQRTLFVSYKDTFG